jgi:hypothetical protein
MEEIGSDKVEFKGESAKKIFERIKNALDDNPKKEDEPNKTEIENRGQQNL